MKVLGTPVGHPDAGLFSNPQAIVGADPSDPRWLVLLFCAGSRANCLLRAVPPECAEHFAVEHDDSMRRWLCSLLGCDVPDTSGDVAGLPFSIGGHALGKLG